MTAFEKFQNSLLKQLGYDVAPFEGDWQTLYVYLKDGKFCFLDQDAKDSYRAEESISGDILIQKNDEGYHCCPSTNKDGEPILYHLGVRFSILDSEYYILWENNEYTELSYLHDSCFHFCSGDTIEYKITDHYIAIKFHQENNSMIRDDKPYLDALISREKDIYHLGVKTHFLKDKIVVAENNEDEDVIVYDNEMNVLYEGYGEMGIMEEESKCYLIFPSCCTVYELTEGKEIRLPRGDNDYWSSVKVYKDIFVLYTEHRNRSFYANSDSCWDYDYEDIPITNTDGVVYNLQFKLLRRFNVYGEIFGIADFGDTKVIKVLDSDNDRTVLKLFNVKGENIIRHNEDVNEDFSIPDMSFIDMIGYENQRLTIVKTKMYSPNIISIGDDTQNNVVDKCGVYIRHSNDTYNKVIDCKYDNIKSIPLKSDHNIYYIGVIGRHYDKKYDLYVNHKLFLSNYPYNREHTIEVSGRGHFIKFSDSDGNIGFIRNGEIVFKSQYEDVKVCVCSYGRYEDDETELEYLFIVSNGELYGICSPSGELILPIEYPIVDIDDNLTIVTAKRIDEMEIDENDKSILRNYYHMVIGSYSKESNSIILENATVKDDEVIISDNGDYVWDGEFKSKYKEMPNEWSPEYYSHEDAMYDALGGEMDAIWNID